MITVLIVVLNNKMLAPKKYTVRPGTIDSGKPYEIKTTALLALKCLLNNLEDFWIASNVEECGDFDDVVLFKKEKKKNGVTYLVQLKHQDTPSHITRKDILEGKKYKDFFLKKYLDGCLKFSHTISNETAEKSDIIEHFRINSEIIYIIFTNRNVEQEFEFLEPIRSSSDLLNINGNVYRFKSEKLNIFTTQNDPRQTFIKQISLYTKQPHIEKIDNKIKDVIKKLISSINKSDKDLDEIVKKFVFFVEEWYRGRLDGHYPLTKMQVLKKITEILLESFMVKLNKEIVVQQEENNQQIWDEMIQDKNLIIINGSDEVVYTFLERSVCTFVAKHKNYVKNCKTLKKDLMRIPGNIQIISFWEIYEFLWKTRQIPLMIQVYSKSEFEEVVKILRLHQETFRIIILNKSDFVPDNLQFSNMMFTVSDLKDEQQRKLFKFPITLQGRCLNGFEKLNLDINLISELKVKDIIYILCNQFNIGEQFEPLPDIFIDVSLKRVWLKPEVLQEVIDDIFIIHCHFLDDFNDFIQRDIFDIDESEIIEWKDMEDNFNSEYHRIILYENADDLNNIEDYFKCIKGRSIHFLIYHKNFKFEWINSWGTINSLKDFRKTENYEENGVKATEIFTRMKSIIISANPGMGKSIFINYFAQNAPTSFWIIKINLSKHKNFISESKCDFNPKTFFEQTLKEDSFLVKSIFVKFYELKSIIILLDGFDEIPINYQNDAKEFIKLLNKSGYLLVVTTRPVLKNDLESLLDTFAINLSLFTRMDQEYYLKNYFSKFAETVCESHPISLFVENLLNSAKSNLNDRDNEFTGVPLQTLLLAEVFIEDFKIFLKTEKFINKQFDLLYLYKSFIEKKIRIACAKFGSISEDLIYQYKICRTFYALRLLFSEDDLEKLQINLKLEQAKSIFPDMLQLLQKDGIAVAEIETNVRFVHQTFAEYITAEWLVENIKNRENKEVSKILLKATFEPNLKIIRNIFDRILARDCPLHLAIINSQMDKVTSLINSIHFNDVDAGDRNFLHLLASWGFQPPKKYQYKSFELSEFKKMSHKDEMMQILKLIPDEKLKHSKDQIFEYTPIDYAILSRSLHIANMLCQKMKTSRICIDVNNLLEPFQVPYCKKMNYLSLHREIVNHISIDSNLFIDKNDRDSLSFVISRRNLKKLNSIISNNFDLNECDMFDSSPLHVAVRLQKEEIVKIFLEKGATTNTQDINGKTPLHWCVIHENLNILKLLISNKQTNVNMVDLHNRTALHYAIISCRQHQIEIISELSNANFNIRDIYGMTPLLLAADYGFTDCINSFLQLGVDIEQNDKKKMTALHYAAINGYIDMVKLLLSKGANINAKTTNDTTPLIFSIRYGHTNIINFLLDQGANIQAIDKHGRSALYWAACSSCKDTLTLLMDKDVNVKTEYGVDALCAASQYGDKNIVDLLLSCGVPIDSKNKKGNTPLHWAAFSGRKDMVKLLLSKGANINEEDNQGNTALYWALCNGHIQSVKLLLSHSKKVKIPNNCLHVAAKCGHKDLINLFLLRGTKINLKDELGMTALHYAVNNRKGSIKNVAFLLAKGADIESKNNNGKTPLILAVTKGFEEAVDLLLREGANLETKTSNNETPLIVSAKYGQNDVTNLLISKGAKIKAKDNKSRTAFHWASFNNYTTIETMELFLAKSLDFLNLHTAKQETPLILAAQSGALMAVRLLLSKNVDIEAKDHSGMNALHWASLKGYRNTVYVLLENNADLEAKDNEGKTALLFAGLNGHEDVVRILLSNGANPNAEDKNGFSARYAMDKK